MKIRGFDKHETQKSARKDVKNAFFFMII